MENQTKPVVKLIGKNGNAFQILGQVCKTLKQAGMAKEAKQFLKEATSGDYNKLLRTAMQYVEVE